MTMPLWLLRIVTPIAFAFFWNPGQKRQYRCTYRLAFEHRTNGFDAFVYAISPKSLAIKWGYRLGWDAAKYVAPENTVGPIYRGKNPNWDNMPKYGGKLQDLVNQEAQSKNRFRRFQNGTD